VNPALTDLAVEFAATAEKAIVAVGGVDLARAAEIDPARRGAAKNLLDNLGLGDLDPGSDLETAVAAAELCRVAGRYALPYPVVPSLLSRRDAEPLALVTDTHIRVNHGDLLPRWRVATIDGHCTYAGPAGPVLGSKLGPFVTDLIAEEGTGPIDGLEVALHLTLTAWQVLGAAERAVELAVEHVRDRHQFGQALSQFQSVQFQMADAAVATDGLRELCRFTLWRVFDDPDSRLVDPLALRLHVLDVARAVLRITQQLFGAAGLCDEYDVSVLLRHIQPDLRLPFGAEQTATRLFGAVERDGFESLFPHGGRT
jgi:3-oxo-4-pregnene-20-carboxyl-CoA dehydrogenase alpha subunit